LKKAQYLDLVFPLKLRPLTYRKPEGMEIGPGSIVRAELKKSVRRALVLGSAEESPPETKDIHEAAEIDALSPALLKLLRWMSEYYMADPGSVLKAMYGEELFERPKRKEKIPSKVEKNGNGKESQFIPEAPDVSQKILGTTGYRAFLYKPPSRAGEREFCFSLLKEFIKGERKGAIILMPELSRLPFYKEGLEPVCGKRFTVLHGELTKARRLRVYQKILSGECDIILGTRLAVFAPLKKTALIIVTEEENINYKNEEGVRFNARDVAVARASFEGASILLSSIDPSAESWLNSINGKYELIRGKDDEAKRRLKLINMRKTSLASPSISGELKKSLSSSLNKRAVLVLNRFGHSVPYCEDCAHVERCPSCGIALTFHKKRKSLSCNYCGFEKPIGEACPNCGGPNLKMLGAGLERVEEELKTLGLAAGDLLIGTKGVLKEIADGEAETAALLNPELAFFHPNFRSRERVFQEMMHLKEKLSPKGSFYVQTMEPGLFNDMKDLDYEKFIEGELAQRKAMGYPPFTKIANITLSGAREGDFKINVKGAEVLGPSPRLTKTGKKVLGLLVKAHSSRALRAAIKELLSEIKAKKITVDIDPV
jgi:primosomal protein N' (replication factor Y)